MSKGKEPPDPYVVTEIGVIDHSAVAVDLKTGEWWEYVTNGSLWCGQAKGVVDPDNWEYETTRLVRSQGRRWAPGSVWYILGCSVDEELLKEWGVRGNWKYVESYVSGPVAHRPLADM